MTNITIFIAVFALIKAELFVEKLVTVFSTFIYVYDKTIIFLAGITIFLS